MVFKTVMCAGVAVLFGTGTAVAGSFVFDFDALSAGQNASAIQTYMNGVLGGGNSVVVTNIGNGVLADRTYSGDGHVIGPCNGNRTGSTNCGQTLGSTGGNSPTLDTYLKASSAGTVQAGFTFAFTLPHIVIDNVGFDYQIFPDASCRSVSYCSSGAPDFTFRANLNGGPVTSLLHDQGVAPSWGNDNSYRSRREGAPQLLVTGYTTDTPGATTFTFLDWPATIGIDNFVVNYHTPTTTSVPEPASIFLLGTIAAAALYLRRKRASC